MSSRGRRTDARPLDRSTGDAHARSGGAAGPGTGERRTALPPAELQASDRWLLVLAIVSVAALLTAASFRCIWEADFWWQYATGERIAASGVPSTDVFSYVSAGRPWIELRWLYCLLLYESVRMAGYAGPIVLKWIVLSAAFALVTASAVTRRTAAVACAALALAILASSQRFFVRPELATYFFLGLFVWIISRYRKNGGRGLYALPALQIVWVNSHTLFLLGPLLAGLLLTVETGRLLGARKGDPGRWTDSLLRVRTVAIVLAGTVLACLVNPYGTRAFTFSFQIFQEIHSGPFKEAIQEFKSPFSFDQTYSAVVWWEALIAVSAVSAFINIRNLDPFWTLLAVSQLYLSAISIRNLPLFGFAAVPFILTNFQSSRLAVRPAVRHWARAAARAVACLVTIGALFYAWSFATDRFNVQQGDTNQFGAGMAKHRFPEAAVAFLRDKAPPSSAHRVFAPMFESSYLLAHGYTVFIDPRLEIHGEDHFARYVRMMTDAGAWDAADKEFSFHAAIVDLLSPFLTPLVGSGEWSLVYFDEVAALFMRRDLPGAPRPILSHQDFKEQCARLRTTLPSPRGFADASFFSSIDSPTPYLHVALFLLRLGQRDQAEPFASDALSAWPQAQGAHAILAQIHEGRGEVAEALREYEAELAVAPDSPSARRQLGLLYLKTGRTAEARACLERSVAEAPSEGIAWAALAKLHSGAGRMPDAIRCAEKAVECSPRNANFQKNLGRLYAVTGNPRDAIATLTKAVSLDGSDPTVLRDLAVLHLKIDEPEEALILADRALALAPADPDLIEVRSAILKRQSGASSPR